MNGTIYSIRLATACVCVSFWGLVQPSLGHAQHTRDTDPRNTAQIRAFPQCSVGASSSPNTATTRAHLSKSYIQRWLDARRDNSDRIQVPGLGDWDNRNARVREVMSTYFHVHYGEKDGREEHYCLPYDAVKYLRVISTDQGNVYQIILYDEWLHS